MLIEGDDYRPVYGQGERVSEVREQATKADQGSAVLHAKLSGAGSDEEHEPAMMEGKPMMASASLRWRRRPVIGWEG
jgi:hypothetical protein